MLSSALFSYFPRIHILTMAVRQTALQDTDLVRMRTDFLKEIAPAMACRIASYFDASCLKLLILTLIQYAICTGTFPCGET